jgi:hypothetical protein
MSVCVKLNLPSPEDPDSGSNPFKVVADNPAKSGPVMENTTILHLNQFAPDGSPQPSAGLGSELGMTHFIQRAAAETVENSRDPIIVPKNAQALPAKEMLGAVSYAYAKDVFESDRIEQKLRQDPALREQLGDNLPDAQSIRKFRKLNRNAIMQTIEKAFRLKRRKEKEELMKPLPGQPVTAVPVPPQDGENTVMISKQQAEQKIENAILIDNMSRED